MCATLLDAFETILLPRRISHRFRYSRLYYRTTWGLSRRLAYAIPAGKWREALLSVFGPASMLGLFISWIAVLLVGFALMQAGCGPSLTSVGELRAVPHSAFTYLYFSGTTYFTLGLGDVMPRSGLPRALTVIEAGLGFGFLAILISYLPVLYQAFSAREVIISLLDAQAGSPPNGGEFIARLASTALRNDGLNTTLREWEKWCAVLLESNISFPILALYRSQHANQSWLAALTTMLDASALLLTIDAVEGDPRQPQLAFAMARHTAVDIALVFNVKPRTHRPDRLPPEVLAQLQHRLREHGRSVDTSADAMAKLAKLRETYEPIVDAMAQRFLLTLPPMYVHDRSADNWQRSKWMAPVPGIGSLPMGSGRADGADHFD